MFSIKTALTATALVATLGISTMTQAKANGAVSTRNLILGAAALVTGLAIEENVAHKHARANTIEGYTQNGSTVYADGRIVDPNGQTYYPGNNGQQVSCSDQSCVVTNTGNNGYYGNNNYGNNGYYGNNPYGNGNGNYANNGNYGNNGYYQDTAGRHTQRARI